ncbi:MAG: PspC domain-containing protein [Bacteroidetes bacterium]|nr:PspC domain-containing protein [Bacteroidota bacterium]
MFGVCSGLGEYFEMDPTVVRLIFLGALLLFGTGVLLYIILAIVMPDRPAM